MAGTQGFWYSIMVLYQCISLCSCECETCYATHLTNFDGLLISEYLLWSRICNKSMACFKLCYSDSLCVSFQFDSVGQSCHGYSSSFTVPSRVQTTDRSGIQLYLTCKGENHFGAACSYSVDCHNVDNICMDDHCQCKKDYRYSSVTRACFKYYFGCYQDRLDRHLKFLEISRSVMTTEYCVDHCRTNGYAFAGTQYSSFCFCDNTIKAGYAKYPESNCNMKCRGDNSQICGATFTNSIYATRP